MDANQNNNKNIMLLPAKTERGWELADHTGTFEAETISEVFPSKQAAQEAANKANAYERGWDELSALELQHDHD
jgi:hypothetical protein